MTVVLAGLLFAAALLDLLLHQSPWQSLAGLYAGQSLLALAAYGWDKLAAMRQRPRLPERSLLLIGLLGGWPGALLAQRLFRHKTAKTSFLWRFWLTVLLNLATLLLVLYYTRQLPLLPGPP